MRICLDGELTRGATLADWDRRGEHPANCRILLEHDKLRWRNLLRLALRLEDLLRIV